MSAEADSARVTRLREALEWLERDDRARARDLLRDLIREDSDFEAAWLWMSVAVDSLDESAVCLDNVLRVNPNNAAAAEALLRIRAPEYRMLQERGQIRFYRDMAFAGTWLLMLTMLFGAFFTIVGMVPG